MRSEGISTEQGVVKGDWPKKEWPEKKDWHEEPPAAETPQPKETLPLTKVDLGHFYQEELQRFENEAVTPETRAWSVLEKTASENDQHRYSRRGLPEETAQKYSFVDKAKRQALLLQARREGFRDVGSLSQLIDHFESTIQEIENKYVKLPKGLTEEQKNKIREQWKEKGWGADFHEYEKHTELSLDRWVPVRVGGEHLRQIKKLYSSETDPLPLVKSLEQLGFRFSEWELRSPEYMDKIAQLLSAPQAKRALELARGITNWGPEWFPSSGSYGRKEVEVGQIDFLIQLAQHPNPETILSLELAHKIDVLSRVLNEPVCVPEIEQFKTLGENPTYLEFVSVVSEQARFSGYGNRISTFDHIVALDRTGIMRPLIELNRAGISIDGRYQGPLDELFNSFAAANKPQKVQEKVIQQLQGTLAEPKVQEFLQNREKQELVKVLSRMSGSKLHLSDLQYVDSIFDHRNEAVYLINLLCGDRESATDFLRYRNGVKTIQQLINQGSIDIYTSQEFSAFLTKIRESGFNPSSYDFYYDGRSRMADLFRQEATRQPEAGSIFDKGTLEVAKALHEDGKFDVSHTDYYIRLAKQPNIVVAIQSLKNLGCSFEGIVSNLPDAELLEIIAASKETLAKLKSTEIKDLALKLREQLQWGISIYEINSFINLYDDKELQAQLFTPENIDFIRKVKPRGLYRFSEAKPLISFDSQTRDLLVQLVETFDYHVNLDWNWPTDQGVINKILYDDALRTKLFSDRTVEMFRGLKKALGYYQFDLGDIETFVNLPNGFVDFVIELKQKYKCSVRSSGFPILIELLGRKEKLYLLLDSLSGSGYQFKVEDLAHISKLSQFADRVPRVLTILEEELGYKFRAQDSIILAYIAESDFSKEKIQRLRELYNKYKTEDSLDFNISWIPTVNYIEEHEETIKRLHNFGYQFNLHHVRNLEPLLNVQNREEIFQVLTLLHNQLALSFQPHLTPYYIRLANIPGVGHKIQEAGISLTREALSNQDNFILFVILGAESGLYTHAANLLNDPYFRNTRDAANRLHQFSPMIMREEIAPEVAARMFAISGKATELDRLALKLMIDGEIAQVGGNKEWAQQLLEATNFQEANDRLTKLMTKLALPVIYSDLEEESLVQKQGRILELAEKDSSFEEVLGICCRSVGVFGRKYPNRGTDFDTLMGAIKNSLELNLERDPKKYAQERLERSTAQFDRLFEDFSSETRERVLGMWADLTVRRRLRVSGSVVTAEEATLSRLNRIRDLVQIDLSVHLQNLFLTKFSELEQSSQQAGRTGAATDQLNVFKQYLFTPEGQLRQDIPHMYLSIERFVRDAQKRLRDPETPREEKSSLGRNLGIYQAISDSLKALYRLGTINEERYKARRAYLNQIDKHIGEFSASLKKLRILDPERRSSDVNIRALEEEVLIDLGKLKSTTTEENISAQTIIETESTVDFRHLAQAPDITQSCQRLTEVTGFNHAAYSRFLDGTNEMIDIYEMKNGQRNRLARSFIELSKMKVEDEKQPRLAILLDREYVNPQYQSFTNRFYIEMIAHLLDRVSKTPEVCLVINHNQFGIIPQIESLLKEKGYYTKEVTGEYFINESNVKLAKYYDSLGGLRDVKSASYTTQSQTFYMIEQQF